jgi:hypothetical protein
MTTTTGFTLVAIFDTHRAAERAVEELRRAGFREDQFGFAVDAAHASAEAEDARTSTAASAAGVGMLVGASAGGLVAGSGAVAAAPVVASGLLLALLGGGVAGGLLGALIGLGVPQDEAHYYQRELEAGRTLVTVQTEGRYDEALAILSRHGGREANPPVGSAAVGNLP